VPADILVRICSLFVLEDYTYNRYVDAVASRYGYGLELAGNIPDQGSGVKRNIGIIAYLVKYGDGRGGLYCFACALVHEDRFDVLCGAPDIPRYGIIAHNTF
jgi:hypothetical protein